MSQLRPTLVSGTSADPCMRNGTAFLLIYRAVKDAPGLIHGRLDGATGEHCALGHYFERHRNTCLPTSLIDEVAAVNDSVPHTTPRQRKLYVLRWLRWQLKRLEMPV